MEPIPAYARLLGVALAVVTAPMLVLGVALTVWSAAATYGSAHRISTFQVGTAPVVHLDLGLGGVRVVAGSPGSVLVDDEHDAATITRAGAAAVVDRTSVTATQHGNEIDVTAGSNVQVDASINRSGSLIVHVPPRADLVVTGLGSVDVEGVDGAMQVTDVGGDVTLRDVTLRGDSRLSTNAGSISLTNAVVAGTARLGSRLGDVGFDGSLLPGGSTLTITAGAGDITIVVPDPTDARATVQTQQGTVHTAPAWQFVPDAITPHRWSADLGPDPTGAIDVDAQAGNVTFEER